MTASHLQWQVRGAQVLQASCGGVELLYLSPAHANNRSSRGGIPVLFPQFADRGSFKKHGWARDMHWTFLDERIDEDGHAVRLQLVMDERVQPSWPHSAVLAVLARVTENSLEVQLQVQNTGSTVLEWSGGLHPYWATGDLLKCSLKGLQGVAVQDRYAVDRSVEVNAEVSWSGGRFESLYDTNDSILLCTPSHALRLSMTGFDQWMVWNPGAEDAKLFDDLPNDDWPRFVCIEPVRIDRPCCLQSGQSFTGSLKAELFSNFGSAES